MEETTDKPSHKCCARAQVADKDGDQVVGALHSPNTIIFDFRIAILLYLLTAIVHFDIKHIFDFVVIRLLVTPTATRAKPPEDIVGKRRPKFSIHNIVSAASVRPPADDNIV